MDPVTSTITIGRPREEVFDYLADVANHPEFSDHYLKDWHLTRVDSVGRGAGARFRRDRRLDRFGWQDMTFIEVERPVPDRGRRARREVQPQQDLLDVDAVALRRRHEGRVHDGDRAQARRPTASWRRSALRRWFKRGGRKALRRLQSILEEDHDRGKRATVAGV